MGTSKSSVDPTTGQFTDYSTPPTSDYRRSLPLDDGPTTSERLEHETSDEIRDDISSTRSRMDETLDELGDRLNPRRLVDDIFAYFSGPKTRDTAVRVGESASEFSQNLGRTIRENPVPSLLIGAGVAWLMFGDSQAERKAQRQQLARRRRQLRGSELAFDYGDAPEREYVGTGAGYMADEAYYERFYDDEFEDDDYSMTSPEAGSKSMYEKAKEATATAGETVSDVAASAGKGIAEAASSVAETVKDATSSAASVAASAVSSTASSLASGITGAGESVAGGARRILRKGKRTGAGAYRYGASSGRQAARSLGQQQHQLVELYDRAADRYHEASREYPLAVGAGCLALGMLTGLLVPRTQREDEWMGDASDELRHDAWETGEELVERGKQVASATAHKAAQAAEQHGLSGESLLERGERVASKVVAAASEALDQEGLSPDKIGKELKAVGEETRATATQEATKLGKDAEQKAAKIDPDLAGSAGAGTSPIPGKPSSTLDKPATSQKPPNPFGAAATPPPKP
jgi:hypothetical protein